jgi:hypothetical protein
MVKLMYLFGQNMGWATFWAIFTQTHLVTLVTDSSFFQEKSPPPRQHS